LEESTVLFRIYKKVLTHPANLWFRRLGAGRRRFTFAGRTYPYFYHAYNVTWLNERAVEIPIIMDFVNRYRGKRILEVGNVLSHYVSGTRDIVDKHERGAGVINADLTEYNPPHRYDLIVSISTLEHIGWDEDPRKPEKILSAVKRMKSLLKEEGLLVATAPIGYNAYLDDSLAEGGMLFDGQMYMKREPWGNRWRETETLSIPDSPYNFLIPHARGLVIWTHGKEVAKGPSDP
jgi:hypothetical protein